MTLGPIQPRAQWVQGALSLGCDADLSPLSSHISSWHDAHLSMRCIFMVYLVKHGDNKLYCTWDSSAYWKGGLSMFYPHSHDKSCLTAKYSLLTGVGCHHWSSCYSWRWGSSPAAAWWRSAMRVPTSHLCAVSVMNVSVHSETVGYVVWKLEIRDWH
jgi:hypothetical protein